MFTRIYNNLYNVLNIYYLVTVLEFSTMKTIQMSSTPGIIAMIQLTMFVASTGISLFINKLFRKIGRRKTYSIGTFFGIIAAIAQFFLTKEYKYIIFAIVVFVGAA